VTHVYNPLRYARALVEQYLDLAASAPKEAILLGMNPGPWGMAQTGVPFGTVSAVRDWMHISGAVERPRYEHPKRPVLGLDVQREEVSGQRFWGWAKARFVTPRRFFARFFVANYCPLLFLEASGRNRTPDKLPAAERELLNRVCDAAFCKVVAVLEPRLVIGIGKFAEDRARAALKKTGIGVGGILHPSPASPAANRGWQAQAEKQLSDLGVLDAPESA
jgi:single-strand selective monofunctional uracil DNA glycosylase